MPILLKRLVKTSRFFFEKWKIMDREKQKRFTFYVNCGKIDIGKIPIL